MDNDDYTAIGAVMAEGDWRPRDADITIAIVNTLMWALWYELPHYGAGHPALRGITEFWAQLGVAPRRLLRKESAKAGIVRKILEDIRRRGAPALAEHRAELIVALTAY